MSSATASYAASAAPLPPEPSPRALMEQALFPHVLLGMPHLAPTGLSETWLMKELGHRHWLMLARHLGMENADFRTPDGAEAYAAICATSLDNAGFEAVRANDVLTIRSALSPVSRTQVSTRHLMSAAGAVIGEVELISAFVRRTEEGDNHSIARVPLPGPTPAEPTGNALARTAAALRGGTLAAHFGLAAQAAKPLRGFRVEPALSQEFNGAGLFYFAEFQALADRAFERWFPERRLAARRREVFFSGNIRPGEALQIELTDIAADGTAWACRLRRQDGKVIGRIFSAGRTDGRSPADAVSR
ncbi:Pnap_2097 family protein [Rhizobium binxianense]